MGLGVVLSSAWHGLACLKITAAHPNNERQQATAQCRDRRAQRRVSESMLRVASEILTVPTWSPRRYPQRQSKMRRCLCTYGNSAQPVVRGKAASWVTESQHVVGITCV
mmetsp:Transcript_98937/g.255760  ORF Transcript_98937/g.255760 Transcript_98937/m.255760 type:complete len:109 (+) Transcript_98937:375-701(+)